MPFSLEEALAYNVLEINNLSADQSAAMLVDDYLHNGGFPETMHSRALAGEYLGTLYDSIIWKDIVQRHKVRITNDLYNLANYLLSNFCNPFTVNDVTRELGLRSVATTQKFCRYLNEPYLFFYLPRYNNKLKLMKKAPQKIYVVDNGFLQSSAFRLSENLGRLLENQVFVELMRRCYDVEKSLFYYRSRNDREVDFVLRCGLAVHQLIQVCYDLSSPKTVKREVDSIIECAGELHCSNLTIVTLNERQTITRDGYTINVVPVTEF